MPLVRVFLSSFLVLFLEVALIRWMPAHIRLLAYFSNFILLASFLGIGLGCLLAPIRASLFALFPLLQLGLVLAVQNLRLEVAVPKSGAIYFTSGTAEKVVTVESTLLLPLLFGAVALLFICLAQRMAREMSHHAPLRAYSVNLLGSLAGVVAFAIVSWLELPPTVWFGAAFVAALPLLDWRGTWRAPLDLVAFALTLVSVYGLSHGALWSPYYKITVSQHESDTVIEVNNIFHQSMAPLERKEYFYEWPYRVFGDSFEDVLILGAGSGTDVAAALRHGAKRVDAVEIDPAILRLGGELNPERPYGDPRVRRVTDDARHFLRTTDRKYDLVVFALIDSLTLQSSFSAVRLESYMFTEESFRAVRDRLSPDGVLVIYNYFREPWLIDRLANTAALAFGDEPRVHVHAANAYLGILLAGPRVQHMRDWPPPPERVQAYGQDQGPSPARLHHRDTNVVPATDDWPFLYMRSPHLPRHYLFALAVILTISTIAVLAVVGLGRSSTRSGQAAAWSWHFFFLGAGFMLLETKSIIQFALLWGSTWVVASLTIASVLTMALAANFVVSRVAIRKPWVVGAVLLALLGTSYLVPIGRVAFESRALESIFYALLVFSPIFCAGLLFGSSIKHSQNIALDYGANLLGAMAGGVAEYLSLVTGFQFLIVIIALCYVAALLTIARVRRVPAPARVAAA